MSAFTVFSSDCIPLSNLIDGLGAGQWGRMSWADGQSLLAPRGSPGREWEKGRSGGGDGGDGGRGKDRLKAGPVVYTSKAYISSEQNNSFDFFYAKV